MTSVEIKYQEALDYLYSFIDYSLTRSFRYAPEKFDLGRMHDFMQRLGNPHLDYKVIHIAGTKGKGSVGAMVQSALRKANYRVGFYTSPHLHDYCERIQVNGQSLSHDMFVELIEELKPHIEESPGISTFELTTALAFLYYSRMNVDIAVIEVGLGGRLDATNIVDPLVSIITSLSYDHVHVLGDTLAQIAFEKAGIIKNGRPVILSPQREEARKVVEKVASERGSQLLEVGKDLLFAPWSRSLSGQSLLVWSAQEQELIIDYIESGGREDWEPTRLAIPLLGYHQVENAATAYAALQSARKLGVEISETEIQLGFQEVNWPGRFEVMRKNPPIIIDSAHNPDSALKLRLAIDDYLPGQPVILLFGASEDKDIRGMFNALLPRAHRLIITQSVHPRAIDPEELVGLAHQFGCLAQAIVPIEEAVQTALEFAGKESAIVVAGSLFIAAAVRDVLISLYPDYNLDSLKQSAP